MLITHLQVRLVKQPLQLFDFHYPPDPGEHVLKKSATEIGEQEFPVKRFNFIYPSSNSRMTETSTLTYVDVAYSPIAFMNHQWTINLHDGYPPLHVLLPEEYIPSSLPTHCNLKSTMFHFGVDLLHSTTEPQHDLPSLASPKGEMASSFSWTSLFKSPTSSTLCFGEPTLAKLDQVKLLCESKFLYHQVYSSLYPWELHSCSHPRPYHTSQRCIFKTNLLHLQVKYHQERLKKPHRSILPRSTSHYPMELRIFLPLTKSCPSTGR